VCSYIGNYAGGDWFLENVMLVNRVTGAWRAWEEGRRRRKMDLPRECSEEKRPWRPPPFKNSLYSCAHKCLAFFLDCLNLKDGIDRLSQNIGN
jgi:hypothetical protein